MVGGIFCDLDCVSHDILLSKLKFYEVIGETFVLLKSYLVDRHQGVILNDKYANHNTYSDRGKIKHGLGQLLFLLYINDIPKTQIKIPKYLLLQMTLV